MTQAANTDPRHGRAGRQPTRQFLDSLSGNVDPGLFGRMFPNLPPLTASDAQLQALVDAMKDANPSDPGGDSNIPSGFTYLGQFVDHDITLDLTSIAEKQEDPLATTNFRTPRLDLDYVYGLGPDGSPQLYARDPANITQPGPKLLIGKTGTTSQVAGGVSERPAAQPRGPRPDRRPSQRREPARCADAARFPQIPQQGRRQACLRPQSAGTGPALRRGPQTGYLALPMDGAARLGRADHRNRDRRQDPARGAEVLPVPQGAIHAGRVLGSGLQARPQHGARSL